VARISAPDQQRIGLEKRFPLYVTDRIRQSSRKTCPVARLSLQIDEKTQKRAE